MTINPEITELVKDLESPQWTERNRACESIQQLRNPEEVAGIIQHILNTHNHVALYSLIRESLRLKSHISAVLIREVLREKDPPLIKEIISILEKLEEKEKIGLCLDLFSIVNKSAVLIEIIKILGETRTPRQVFPLLEMIKTSPEPVILAEIINSFRKIKDVRTISPLSELAAKKQLPDAVCFPLLLTLGELAKQFPVNYKIALPYLNHPQDKTRQAAVWCLAQFHRSGLFEKMIKKYETENAPQVRYEILKRISSHPVKKTVSFLFKIINTSQDSRERLLASSSLEALPDQVCLKVLRKELASANPNIRSSACEHIGMKLNPEDIPTLLRVLNKDTDDNVRAAAAEILGLYNNEAVDQALKIAVLTDKAISYNSVLALCRSMDRDKQDIFMEILSDREYGEDIIQQTIISHLPQFFKHYKPKSSLISILLNKLNDKNANIRYLSIKALGSSGEKGVVDKLVNLLNTEKVAE
ncbi:MAG: HEAT repeat domain-containing protein, partial [bacterium]